MRHTSDGMQIDHLAIAILRHADQIVMVQQLTPCDHQPYWVLPGGLVEAGEFVTDALIREVQEEAGVQVTAIGALVGLSQIHLVHPRQASRLGKSSADWAERHQTWKTEVAAGVI